MALKVEVNARPDNYIRIVEKVAKEVRDFLVKRIPSNKITIQNQVHNHYFGEDINDHEIDSVLGSIRNLKNNNLYSFMVDQISLSRAAYLIGQFTTIMVGFGETTDYDTIFLNDYPEYFPYIGAIIKKRKFQKLHHYKRDLNPDIYEVVDHLDDMLEDRQIAALVRAQNLMPPTTMTLEQFNLLKNYVAIIEKSKPVPKKKSLKEVPWSSISSKTFLSPLTAKKPPYEGVIPEGKTFLESKNYKWVDIGDSSGGANIGYDLSLNAPYEAFYVRHCGKDIGSTLLSLRVKADDGWFPIAMSTLKKYPYGYAITQLKTYANNVYWSLNSDGEAFLKSNNFSGDELSDAVKQLLLDPRITLLLNNGDLNIGRFKDDSKIKNKVKKELDDYIKKSRNSKIATIRKILVDDMPDLNAFKDLQDDLFNQSIKYFAERIEQIFPEFNGPISVEYFRGDIRYIAQIKDFAHITEAEEFYWKQFPELRQEFGAGSGDRIRYKNDYPESYYENIVYFSGGARVVVIFDFKQINDTMLDLVMDDDIKLFKKRWLSYYNTKKNPNVVVKTKEDEAKWRRAVRSTERKFKIKEKDFGERQWKYVMGTYKRMKHI